MEWGLKFWYRAPGQRGCFFLYRLYLTGVASSRGLYRERETKTLERTRKPYRLPGESLSEEPLNGSSVLFHREPSTPLRGLRREPEGPLCLPSVSRPEVTLPPTFFPLRETRREPPSLPQDESSLHHHAVLSKPLQESSRKPLGSGKESREGRPFDVTAS